MLLHTFYNNIYDMDAYQPTGSLFLWPQIIKLLEFDKALDVGCGLGQGIRDGRKVGKDISGCDIAPSLAKHWEKNGIAEYCKVYDGEKLPYPDNSFDLVLSNDVFEHIPMHDIDNLLNEIYRVGSDKFFLDACIIEETVPVFGKISAHITLKDQEWWFNKYRDNGFKIAGTIDINDNGKKLKFHATAICVKDITPYVKGEKRINTKGWDNGRVSC